MTDFGPLMGNRVMMLFGTLAKFDIFAIIIAAAIGFPIKEAASIGSVGTADGPTTIYVATRFAPRLLGPLSVAA